MTAWNPAIFNATLTDLKAAFAEIRESIASLQEPRLYAAAFVLANCVHRGQISWWRDWTARPPVPIPSAPTRSLVEQSMWSAFGFDASAVLREGSPALVGLGNPKRVLIDPFFDAQKPHLLTVVRETPPGQPKSRNCIKVPIGHSSFLWNPDGSGAALDDPVEYQTGNTFNQQNGVRCCLPASAVGTGVAAATTYSVERVKCPKYLSGDLCSINQERCSSDGAGGTRIPKPRVIVPYKPTSSDWILTPNAFEALVERARFHKKSGAMMSLPEARHLAMVTAWAQQGSGVALSFVPLVSLLGPDLVQVLTE